MKNQQRDVPMEHYSEKFREIDPAEAAGRTGLAFDSEKGRFEIKALGHTIYAGWPELKLTPADLDNCPKALYDYEMIVLTARYIIRGADVPSHGSFKAYRELPWGEVYDPNFTGRCVKRFAYKFGTNIDGFIKAAESLGGVKNAAGDASYDLPFIGSVVCRLILWAPDDEFPPSAQFLFSDNTQFAFDAEDLASVGDVVIETLKEMSLNLQI